MADRGHSKNPDLQQRPHRTILEDELQQIDRSEKSHVLISPEELLLSRTHFFKDEPQRRLRIKRKEMSGSVGSPDLQQRPHRTILEDELQQRDRSEVPEDLEGPGPIPVEELEQLRTYFGQPIFKDEPQGRFGFKWKEMSGSVGSLDPNLRQQPYQTSLEDELQWIERSKLRKPVEERQHLMSSSSDQSISGDEPQQRLGSKRKEMSGSDKSEDDGEDEESEDDESEEDTNSSIVVVRKVEALSDFTGEQDGDLSFMKGEILTVIKTSEDGWWEAENAAGKQGVVPKTLLKIIEENEETSPEIHRVEKSAEIVNVAESANKVPELPTKKRRLETSSIGAHGQGLTTEETLIESFRLEELGQSLIPEREPPPEQKSESSVTRERPDGTEIERDLNATLDEGDFDAIKKKVTPKTLSSCKTNTLFQAFQVCKKLRHLADCEKPEKDDIQKLEKSVNEFTLALVEPLKSNANTRNRFQTFFDWVLDEAIHTKQKEFISHPVVYDLLNYRWYRSFFSARKKSWREPKRWGYFFLNLWTVFDIVFFPFLFVVFFVVHNLKEVLRKSKGTKMCFVLTLGKHTSPKEFELIKQTMSYIVGKYGFSPTNYCVVLHEKKRRIGNIKFGQRCSTSMIEKLEKPSSPSSLGEDLKAAFCAFESQKFSNESKKVVVLFLNDLTRRVTDKGDEAETYRKRLEGMNVNIVPIGIGQHAELSELRKMETKDGTARLFGEYESPKTLGTAVMQGIEGKDLYENYEDYFTTPYFVFFRDTVSYLTLLGLHFAMCLSPSSVSFSRLEWFILVLFIGRILTEAHQFFSSKKQRVEARKRNGRPSPTKNEAGDDNILLKKLISYFRDYFYSDRWNVLDFIILASYLFTVILRIITWKNSTNVLDNRLLAVSEYFYGFIAMFLTLRAFGQVMESMQGLGATQIAFFFIIWDVVPILWQFLAAILAFSLAMTKIYVAEKAYTSGEDSAENLACSESGMICWWNMATHLSWSLLGLADLDQLNSVDNPSVSLIRVLYAFFLIIAVILLVNTMIALLSNTYQQVQNNSLQEWSLNKAITVRTYSTYHPIPVPFNLLSVPLTVLWNLGQKRSCKTWFDSPALVSKDRGKVWIK